MWYKLNEDKTVTKLPNGEFPSRDNFRIGLDVIGKSEVSTVFLGLDHSFIKKDVPILFESMIFEGPHNEYQRRYSTYDQALEGHNNLVKALKEEKDPDFYF